MSKKMTIRMDEKTFNNLQSECGRFGYRSLNAYICKLLNHRQIIEISYGDEIASLIHQIRIANNDPWLRERRNMLCQSYDSLMIEIEKLRSYVELLNTRNVEEI